MTNDREKRAADRKPTSLPAHIITDQMSVACTILDMSSSGARLQVQPGLFLPKRLTIRAAEIGGNRVVEVVWRNRTQGGVRF